MKYPKNSKDNFISKGVMIALYLIGFGVFIIIVSLLFLPFNDWSFVSNSTLFAEYGDFIGGFIGSIFSVAAFFLLYSTFIEQRKTLKSQNENFQLERTDNLFFSLLSAQTNIGLSIKGYFSTLDPQNGKRNLYPISSQDFFMAASTELSAIYKSLEEKTHTKMYSEDEHHEYMQNIESISYQREANEISNEELDDRTNSLNEILLTSFKNSIYKIDLKAWDSYQKMDQVNKMKTIYKHFFIKYHYAIGHYFRHLYHILLFIKQTEDKQLSATSDPSEIDQIKHYSRKYVDFLQAQMSSNELMLLFYDSLHFPKMMELVKRYNMLDNLAIDDLINESHNCVEGITLRDRKTLLSAD